MVIKIKGGITVLLRRWSPKENSEVEGKFREGWIDLRGLPYLRWALGLDGWSGFGGAFQLQNFLFWSTGCQQAFFPIPRGCVKEIPFFLTFLSWVWKC